MAVLVPCLMALRGEFNQLAPSRDRASDGWIADAAHVAGGTSDHIGDESTSGMRGKDADSVDEVHAIDVDVDLRLPGWSMERCVQTIVSRHRNNLDNRLQNVIYNRRIWSRSWGWTARTYTGPNPHDHHAHFGARYTTAQERDTRPWGLLELLEDEMALTEAQVKAAAKEAFVEILADGYAAATGKASGDNATDRAKRFIRDSLRGIVGGPTEDEISTAQAAIVDQLQRIGAPNLTDAQAAQVAQAAVAAIRPLEAKVDALRDHLGDEG